MLLLLACSSCSLFQTDRFVATPVEENGPEGTPIRVEFEGVESLATFRLLRAIEDRLYDLSRAPESQATLQDAALDLEDRYRREGFASARITPRIGPDPEAAADAPDRLVTFAIEEGVQTTVRSEPLLPWLDQLDGDVHQREVLALWLRRASGTLGFGDPLFVESDVKAFANAIQVFLISRGYLDADVSRPEYDYSEDASEVSFRIDAEIGARYRVGEARVGPEIEAILAAADRPVLETGTPAATATIEAYRSASLAGLRNAGYPRATVRAELHRDDEAHTVSVLIHGTPGVRARITEIELEGLVRTLPGVVLGRLEFAEGDLYSGAAVDRSLRALYVTGLFRTVEIDPEVDLEAEPDADGARPTRMVVKIREEPSRTVEVMAGYGSYERLRGKVRFEEANVFGTGRDLAVEGRISQRGERGIITLNDPRFLGTDTLFSISGDAYRREQPTFEDEAWGGTLALRRELFERVVGRVGYSLRLHTNTSSDVLTPGADIDDYTEGNVFVEARYDTREGLIYPRGGFLLNAKLDVMDPSFGASIEFLRTRVTASAYLPLSEEVILALRSDHGILWPAESSDQIPLPERFYNGGENTVRSFREFQLGPKDVNGQPTGGEFRNVLAAELRARLVGTLEGALFVDAGNIGSSANDFGFSRMRYGLGAGLRLALPIGPVRVDGAWNPDRMSGEREWTTHLSVGYPF